MAFKLTYTDGQESDYDDGTKWRVEDGVLKMGRERGKWTVLVSPSHWATIEVTKGKGRDDGDKDRDEKDSDKEDEKDSDKEDEDETGD